MTQFSMLPWTTGVSGDGAAPYTQENSNNFFRHFDVRDPANEGIVLGVLSELAVSGASSPLTVAPGAAVCYGRYWNDTNVTLAVSTPTAGTTGGRVVLRCTWATRQIRLAVKSSPNGVGTIPTLTQAFGNTWEISLATFTITTGGVITLTDDRTFRKVTFRVDETAIESNAVTTNKIANSNVTTAKIADGNVTTTKIADGNVTTTKIADDSVDDTKVGNRVPQLYRRQGGSATNWYTYGTTNYTPTAVRIQTGVVGITVGAGQDQNSVIVTFPVAFSDLPIVIASSQSISSVSCTVLSATQVELFIKLPTSSMSGGFVHFLMWMAIGPE